MQRRQTSLRIEILITIMGVLGALIFFAFYDQAFPSAALKLELSRDQIMHRAQDIVRGYGLALDGYKFALTFQYDWGSLIYLQRTLGIPEMNRRIQEDGLPVWNWQARWFRPMQLEEYGMSLSPGGKVMAFSHRLEEDGQGAALDEDQAQAIVEQYLVETHGWDLDDWEMVSSSSEEKTSGRVDYRFAWNRRDFEIGKSELRLSVSLYGDQVDGYSYYLKTPEDFWREFSEQNNRAGFINSLSYMLGVWGFTGVALAALILSLIKHAWPRKTLLLIPLVAGSLSLLANLNELTLYPAYYATTQEYNAYWVGILISFVISAASVAGAVYLLWVGGEQVGKLAWPRQNKILSVGGDRWMNLARSTWRGLMLGGMAGGYVVIFYLIVKRCLGGWSPADVSYTDLYATPFPFLAPILRGLLPGIQEEILFRLVGVGLILGLTRRRWLALLAPGALWAFAHLSYVRDPYYLRGIELLIPAVFLYGLFFLRFDLTTTIVGHMTYNAILGALPMLRSGEPYYVFSGVVVLCFLLAPMLPGLARSLRRRWRGESLVEPQVKPAGEDDLPGLETLPEHDQEWGMLLHDPQASIYCLKLDGQVIGAALGRLAGVHGMLDWVYVAPEWRDRYWGSLLAEAVCADLEGRGAEIVETVAPADHRLALAFLVSQGWRFETLVLRRRALPGLPELGRMLRVGLSWMRRPAAREQSEPEAVENK
ncbi:MAG: GNAT family N-acetyltransferase [Chloroflexota bacterium]